MPSGKQPGKSALNIRLQGVQHVGVTVHDMDKSMKFYTEVLGGQIVVSEMRSEATSCRTRFFRRRSWRRGTGKSIPERSESLTAATVHTKSSTFASSPSETRSSS